MEFYQKLQELRKQKNLTQEELSEILFVSRTAISKWESGRGYPSIESLKAIAEFFGITIDELLSNRELISIAEKDSHQKTQHMRDLMLALIDCSAGMLLIIPLFGKQDGDIFDRCLCYPCRTPHYLSKLHSLQLFFLSLPAALPN